jgi:hypothetical protein
MSEAYQEDFRDPIPFLDELTSKVYVSSCPQKIMNAQTILKELEPQGAEGYRKILMNHGVTGPCFGVKIEYLKKIQKRVKKDYRLALELYDTGVYDAMYLAGLIADDNQMTPKDLQRWLDKACAPLASFTVPWVAAGSPKSREVALKWIESGKDMESAAGWATLGCLVAIKEDSELDVIELKRLLQRVEKSIHKAPNETRHKMNGFVIAVAVYVKPLTTFAKQVAERIGEVTVDMGDTACKVPFAPDYIRKAEARGAIGKKRKTVKC